MPEETVTVFLLVRHQNEQAAQSQLVCRPGDCIVMELHAVNRGREEAADISVSHMLRDHLSYVPDTLRADQGDAKLLFRLLRWKVPSLAPQAAAKISLHLYVQKENPQHTVPLGAAYTYWQGGNRYGPQEAAGAVLYQKDAMSGHE